MNQIFQAGLITEKRGEKMQYIVACRQSSVISIALFDLKVEVEKYIKEGYRLQGGISISESRVGFYTVAQAMIKE